MRLSNRAITLALGASMLIVSPASGQPTIFLGFDTNTPVQKFTTNGTFLGTFGQNGATGSALDGAGTVWTVAPNFGSNRIERYDASGTLLGSTTAAVAGQWIEDMAYGGGNTIWAGTYEGNVFNIDASTGATLSSFSVPNSSYTGVGFDGTFLWLTGGLAGNDNIYKYSTTGTLLSTINTGFTDGMGLGYDLGSNTLWVGYVGGDVRQFDLAGTFISGFSAPGGAHDGLEIGEVGRTAVAPEPASLVLLGTGLIGICGVVVRRRKTDA